MIDPREFRMALGRFATGITIVTTRLNDEIHGMTVNAFMSVSLEPPLVLVSLGRRAKGNALMRQSGRYAVSILGHEQLEHSDHFAGRVQLGDGIDLVEIEGMPLVAGALAHLVCRIAQTVDAGDHTLFIGEVEHLAHREGKPLLYYAGRYAYLSDTHVYS